MSNFLSCVEDIKNTLGLLITLVDCNCIEREILIACGMSL